MDINSKIYVAGHTGMVGSALVKKLVAERYGTLLVRTHKELDLLDQHAVNNFFSIEKSKNLEMVTRIFFNQRRKMIKNPFNKIFPKNSDILDRLHISLDLRPHNLDFKTYYELTSEFEKLQS